MVHSVSLAAPMLRPASASRLVVTVHDLAWRRHPEATTRRGGAGTRPRWHAPATAGRPLVVPSRLVAADLVAFGVDDGADHGRARRHRPPARPRRRRPPTRSCGAGRCAGEFLLTRRHPRAAQEPRPPRAGLPPGAPVAARPVAAGHRRARRVGPGPSGPRHRRRRLHRRRPRPGAGGAVPARPRLRLRAADRGVRAAAARGHAHGHAGGGVRRGAERARSRRAGAGAGRASSTRSTSTTSPPAWPPS